MNDLGDRMKGYEACGNIHLPRRMPLIVRVDGRAFHTLTASMDRPFDRRFTNAMLGAAQRVADEMQGFVLAYVQSDEASFYLQDWAQLSTEPWFAKDLSKVVSISAATMSVAFSQSLSVSAVFDSRAFVLPEAEVANYFLWRARDWSRNSLAMYAQAHFSHRELHRKGAADMHEMLHGIGKNWTTDLTERERNGAFFLRSVSDDGRYVARTDVLPQHAAIAALLTPETVPTATT